MSSTNLETFSTINAYFTAWRFSFTVKYLCTWVWFIPYTDIHVKYPPTIIVHTVCRVVGSVSKLWETNNYFVYQSELIFHGRSSSTSLRYGYNLLKKLYSSRLVISIPNYFCSTCIKISFDNDGKKRSKHYCPLKCVRPHNRFDTALNIFYYRWKIV